MDKIDFLLILLLSGAITFVGWWFFPEHFEL